MKNHFSTRKKIKAFKFIGEMCHKVYDQRWCYTGRGWTEEFFFLPHPVLNLGGGPGGTFQQNIEIPLHGIL